MDIASLRSSSLDTSAGNKPGYSPELIQLPCLFTWAPSLDTSHTIHLSWSNPLQEPGLWEVFTSSYFLLHWFIGASFLHSTLLICFKKHYGNLVYLSIAAWGKCIDCSVLPIDVERSFPLKGNTHTNTHGKTFQPREAQTLKFIALEY